MNSMGKYREALKYYQECLTTRVKVLRKTHPNIINAFSNIGTLLGSMGRYEEALNYF